MKKTAIKAAKEAGDFLNKNFTKIGRKNIFIKNAHEVVSKVDLGAEKIILKIIRSKFPQHNIFSEEIGKINHNSDYLWAIDPLDGSTNYLLHNPFYSVSITLIKNGEPLLGVIYAPFLKRMFVAEKGKGAFLNGKRIKVSTKTKLNKSFLTFCHGHQPKQLKRAIKIFQTFKLKGLEMRQFGSAALECAWVASGITDNIMIPGTNLYDIAAGILLVREAGGKVTDFRGKNWDIKSKDMLCSNGKIHNKLLKYLKKI